MILAEYENIRIHDIIISRNIKTYFHPVVSVKKKSIVGFEALSRGICTIDSKVIPPSILFNLAEKEELTIDLDRLCREKALACFKHVLFDKDNLLLLFLNVDASIIGKDNACYSELINLVDKLNINPNNIVIEIVESKVNDAKALEKFVNAYKNHGFLIALDDVGVGHSNMSRISIAKPDVLKIDKSLVKDINKEYYKQEVLKSLVNLAKNIGSLVVAEGIEREEEAISILELGVDMLQGYYFSKPQMVDSACIKLVNNKINHIASRFKNYMVEKISNQKSVQKMSRAIVSNIVEQLSVIPLEYIDRKLMEMVDSYRAIECIYVLDESGIQLSETICNYNKLPRQQKFIFKPAQKGSDHSLKDYYLFISTGLNIYITEPYISLASGNLCVTVSAKCTNCYDDKVLILCVDLNQKCL